MNNVYAKPNRECTSRQENIFTEIVLNKMLLRRRQWYFHVTKKNSYHLSKWTEYWPQYGFKFSFEYWQYTKFGMECKNNLWDADSGG